jgi:hypothetical protein
MFHVSIQFNSIQFNSYLFTCQLNSTKANYKVTRVEVQNLIKNEIQNMTVYIMKMNKPNSKKD